MVRDRQTQFIERSLSEDGIDQLLQSQGYGIISLCDGGQPYSIPVSFGYDSDCVYFPFLITSGETTKTDFIDEGTMVRLLVSEVRDLFNWRSVTINDRAQPVASDDEEWEHFIDVLVDHEWFRQEFERATSIESVQGWKLGVDDCHGMERTAVTFE